MPSLVNPDDRRVSIHEHTRPPPNPYHPHPYQSPSSGYPPRSLGMRIPPSPRNYDYPYGPPPPPSPRWQREEPSYVYSPSYDMPRHQHYDMPRDNHQHNNYDMPRLDQQLPRPYMPPMHGDDPRRDPRQDPRMPPSPQEYMERREVAPLRIHYRPSSEYHQLQPSPKRVKWYTGPPQSEALGSVGPNNTCTPGALSLLAKVASGGSSDSKHIYPAGGGDGGGGGHEYASPVRRVPPPAPSPHSPRPILWTPRDGARYGHYAPPRGEWRESHPYPRHHDYYPPSSWTYEGPETPKALTERVSFDEGYYSPEKRAYSYDYPQPSPPDYRSYPPPDAPRQYVTPSSSREMEGEDVYPTAPYTYVQQPRLKEERVLRKKFSWKHYPELERFLIANRDEYLRHSALNYTAEQKQYNNWLTERLVDLAAHHHLVFDPDEFSFVSIRDRIRCYYKSFVQTARKHNQIIKKSHPIKTETSCATPSATTQTTTSTTSAPKTSHPIAETETSTTSSDTTEKTSNSTPRTSHPIETETSAASSVTSSATTETTSTAPTKSHPIETETSATSSATTQTTSGTKSDTTNVE